MNVLLKKRISRYLTVIATITAITACSTPKVIAPPVQEKAPAVFSDLQRDSNYYLDQDKQFGSDQNLVWQFLAAQALIEEQQFPLANAVINSLQTKILTPQETALLNLLMADNAYAQNNLPETQNALTALDVDYLSDVDLVHYLKLQSEVHIRNQLPLEASDTLLLLAPRLTINNEKQEYHDLLFSQLLLLSPERLNPQQTTQTEAPSVDPLNPNLPEIVAITAPDIDQVDALSTPTTLVIDETEKEGWYALAAIYQQGKMRPNLLSRQLDKWKASHADHSALQFMPLLLTNIESISPYQPRNIGVVLPLSGRYQRQGKAVQFGLLTAYHDQLKQLPEAERSALPKLHFFDSKAGKSPELAQQLQAANIDFVVGPLMKKEIDALLPLLANTPVLALNRINQPAVAEGTQQAINAEQIAWHYAFPLSPEEEARQAAQMMLSDGHKKPLIVVPNSSYGKRVANAFMTQWQQLSPYSDIQAEAHYFDDKAQFGKFIDGALHTDDSKQRIQQMRSITNLSLKTEVRSRRDVDAIYIVSKRDELILLKPFIDVSVSPFAPKMPLYASSRSHSLDRNNMQNKELTGLVFSDNHFLLDPESTLSKEIEASWKKQPFKTLRLFSLGYDSYQLIEQLIYLQNDEQAIFKGLIGELSLSMNNDIKVKLSWGTYKDGKLIEITTPTTAE